MAITSRERNHGRQWALVAKQDFELSQLENGEAIKAVKLPYGAIVLGGGVIVSEVFDSTTSDTFLIGDEDDDDRYTNATVNGKALGFTPLDVTGYRYPYNNYVTIKWASGGGTPATGKGSLIVEYIKVDRANEVVPDYDLE